MTVVESKERTAEKRAGVTADAESKVSDLFQRLNLTSEEADAVILEDENEEHLKKEHAGDLKGIRNGRSGPAISHLLFADDSVFFTRGDDKSINALNSALQAYCEGSGQKVNLQKSSIYFGTRCEDQVKEMVKKKLGVHDETLLTTYLGMPTWVGWSPMSNFNFLTGRLWKHLNGWSDRPLSRAGKEVLLKSVAQAIPTYVMSCFQIPVSICEKMRK